MYYTVVEEKAFNGLKNRFSIGQKISDNDVAEVKKFFTDYFNTIYNDRKQLKLRFHKLGTFNEKIELYHLILDKSK